MIWLLFGLILFILIQAVWIISLLYQLEQRIKYEERLLKRPSSIFGNVLSKNVTSFRDGSGL
jgi:hypothetical protein